ncbi:MAG: hypothetical protein ACOCP8_05255 [archaeon]
MQYDNIKNNILLKSINVFCLLIFVLWYITPVLRAVLSGKIFNLFILGLIFIWFITSILLNPSWLTKVPRHLIIVSLMVFIFIFLAILNINGNPRDYLMVGSSFWFPLYAFHFYKSSRLLYLLKVIVWGISISLFVTAITTIIGLHDVPNAARFLTNSNTDPVQNIILMRRNIGKFDFVYGILLLFPLLINYFKEHKIVVTFLLFIIFWIVIKASFTIAILLLFLSLILGIFLKLNRIIVIFITVFFVMFIIIIPNSYFAYPFLLLANIINNPKISSRLLMIVNFLEGDYITHNGTFSIARLYFYSLSLKTFFEHPLTGVGPFYYIRNVGVGYHSQILDDLARYGVIGGFFISSFLVTYFKYIKSISAKVFEIAFENLFIIFVLLSFVNLTFSQPTIGIIMFLLIPSLILIYEDNH